MSDTALFAMLPPFYDVPPHDNVGWYLKRIQEEHRIRIEKYRYLKWAFDNDVFIINNEAVFRFPRTEKVRSNLKYEIEFLNFLDGKVRTSIPKYSYVSESGDFAGYNIIPGKTLTAAAFKTLSRSNKEKAISQLIAFMNVFHSIGLGDFAKFKPRRREAFIDDEKKVEAELLIVEVAA